MQPFVLLPITVLCVLLASVSCQCVEEFEETICENFSFSPHLILDSATNRLTVRNAAGAIIHENFSRLDRVTELRIANSEIAKIEPGAMCCTPNLTSVVVTGNRRFPTVTKHTLQGCHKLKKLTLNGTMAIERGAFVANENLQSLSLNGTTIGDLQDGSLARLPTLSFLSIHKSDVSGIGDKAFSGLENLRNLDLQNNRIRSVSASAFKNLKLLKVLNLSDNQLKGLTWREFDGLKNLRVLFLERNDFDFVDVDRLVAGVPDLERIFLSYDRLRPENRKRLEEVLPKANITLIYAGKPYESV